MSLLTYSVLKEAFKRSRFIAKFLQKMCVLLFDYSFAIIWQKYNIRKSIDV